MRVLDIFSGIGGMSIGLESVGFHTVAFCEVDPFCRLVLAHHWPGLPIHDDVRTLRGADVGAVDLVAGGFPCQPVSVAGKRKGTADDRWLWPEMLRIVREVRPRWVLAENVPGLRTLGADRVLKDLEAEGYACWPLVVGADDVGSPHRRKRVWIVAYAERGARSDGLPERIASGHVPADASRSRAGDRACSPRRDPAEVADPERLRAGQGRAGAPAAGLGREAVADSDAPGRSTERSGGLLDGERQAPRDDADGRGEGPVGEPTGRGLAGPGGCDAGAFSAAPALRWPARPGEPQHDWEAPRLVGHASKPGLSARQGYAGAVREAERPAISGGAGSDDAARSQQPLGCPTARLPERLVRRANREALKALGNAVVPQVVAQIGRAILAAEAALDTADRGGAQLTIAVPTNPKHPNSEANDARACSPVEASAVECSGSAASGPPAVNPGSGHRSTGAPVEGHTGALYAHYCELQR